MQRMFAEHKEVKKEYIAKLSIQLSTVTAYSMSEANNCQLSLPLSPDFEHRPMQRVDYENGKEAITEYRFIGDDRVLLYPLTGRTHQLRIHCAHPDGLGRPILGDPLYGNTPAERMYLHASRLTFTHPFTGKTIEIVSEPPF